MVPKLTILHRDRLLTGLTYIWRAAVVALFGLVLGSVGWIAIRSEDFPAAHLHPTPESLVIQATWPQSELKIPFTIQNHASRSLNVREFETSHRSLQADPLPQTIPARSSARFLFSFNLLELHRTQTGSESPGWDQPFEILVRPITNWGRASLPWRIQGTVSLPARGLPLAMNLGPTLIEQVPEPPMDFDFELHPDLTQLHVTSSSPHIHAELDLTGNEQGQEQEEGGEDHPNTRRGRLTVSFDPALTEQVGPISQFLQMTAQTADGTEINLPEIPVTGTVTPDLVTIPSQLLVTWREFGEHSQRSVVLTSQSGRAFTVLDWKSGDDALQLETENRAESSETSSQAVQLTLTIQESPMPMAMIRCRYRYQDDENPRTLQLPIRLVRSILAEP